MTESQENLAGIIKFHLSSSERRTEVDTFQDTSEWAKPMWEKKGRSTSQNKVEEAPLGAW